MTDAELNLIRERCAKATPGPWVADIEGKECFGIRQDSGEATIVETDNGYYPPNADDATFIAGARTDVPALLAEVDRLRAALATPA